MTDNNVIPRDSTSTSREQELEIIFNTLNDIISLVAVEQGPRYRFISVNQVFLFVTGRKKEEVEGRYIDEIIAEPSLTNIISKYEQAIAERRTVEWEETLDHPLGNKFGAVNVTPVVNENGECVMLVTTTQDITKKRKGEMEQKYIRHLLKERVKELTTLYCACQILQDETKPPEAALQELVSILPDGWQYPEITEARIVANENFYATPNYKPGLDTQSAEFTIGEKEKGVIEVIYLEKKPPDAEGPFLAEERNLINMLAEMLSNYFTRRRAIEERVQEQKKMTRAVLNAQENERTKIGQELHDNVNQILVGAKMHLGLIDTVEPGTKDLIIRSMNLLDNAINEIRSLSRREVTPARKIGLKDIIQSLVDSTNEHSALKTNFVYHTGPFVIDEDLKLNIYRIIQEAMNNVVKHADARNVLVVVEAVKNGLHIMIKDDGKGFDPARVRYKGIGMTNILNRVETYNGSLHIDGEPKKGCKIEISIPL